MKPIRVQLKRAKGYKMPENTLKVDRSTKWGNPFNATQVATAFPGRTMLFPMRVIYFRAPPSLDRCIDLFIAYAAARIVADPDWLERLRGKNLACWCPLDQPCHADVLLEIANRD